MLNYLDIFYAKFTQCFTVSILKVLVTQSCQTFGDPMDCSPLGSSVPRISQARILEWVTVPLSRGSCQPRDQTLSPASEPPEKPISLLDTFNNYYQFCSFCWTFQKCFYIHQIIIFHGILKLCNNLILACVCRVVVVYWENSTMY